MKLSREEILRMVGLTSRGLGSRLNEIEEGLEGAGDTLERYWTQIVKNEREITLIAGREAENETNIAQLQVTAREISARVTTVSNEVDDISGVVTQHTTKIGELTVSDSQIRASVSTLTTTVNSNTTKIGQLEVSDSQIRASVQTVSDTVTTQGQTIDGLSSTVSTHTTKIGQLEVSDSQIRASVQTVSDTVTTQGQTIDGLSSTVSTHTTKIGQLEVSDSQIRASVQTVSDNLDTVSGTVSSHTTKIGQLEVSDTQIRSSVSSLTTTVNGHTSKISTLEQTDSTIQASVSSLSSTVGTNTSDIASLKIKANSIDLRVEEIEDDYVTSATLSLYVSKNSVSWLTGSADNVIFNFSNVFQIQHNNTAVLNLDADGNLKITGQLEQNSTIGTILPIRVDSGGNLMRQTVDGTWIANYAGRFVKYKNFIVNNDTFEMRPGDDLLLSNGNYDPKNVYLPLNPANGKVITIKNIGGKTVIRPARNSTQAIRMTDQVIDHFDLNTYDRAEFVFYEGTWWGNCYAI